MAARDAAFALALAVTLLLSGCQSTFYDEYRAGHPGFDASLPREDASLLELLAALHAPAPLETIEVSLARLSVFRVDGGSWEPLPFDAIRSGELVPAPEGDHAVLVGWRCRFDEGLSERSVPRAGFYLLAGGGLAAWDHYAFRERCAVEDQFLAARGPLVAAEREAAARIAAAGTRFSLAQAYRRGLAYLEAGRLDEARAMLLIGERSYRASAAALRASGSANVLAEVEPMRAALLRALGVEPRSDASPPPRR